MEIDADNCWQWVRSSRCGTEERLESRWGSCPWNVPDGITGRSPQAEVQLPSSPGGFGRSAWKIPEVKIKSKPLESQKLLLLPLRPPSSPIPKPYGAATLCDAKASTLDHLISSKGTYLYYFTRYTFPHQDAEARRLQSPHSLGEGDQGLLPMAGLWDPALKHRSALSAQTQGGEDPGPSTLAPASGM